MWAREKGVALEEVVQPSQPWGACWSHVSRPEETLLDEGLGIACPWTFLCPQSSSPELELEVLREQLQLTVSKRNQDWKKVKEFINDWTEEAVGTYYFFRSGLGKKYF